MGAGLKSVNTSPPSTKHWPKRRKYAQHRSEHLPDIHLPHHMLFAACKDHLGVGAFLWLKWNELIQFSQIGSRTEKVVYFSDSFAFFVEFTCSAFITGTNQDSNPSFFAEQN